MILELLNILTVVVDTWTDTSDKIVRNLMHKYRHIHMNANKTKKLEYDQ